MKKPKLWPVATEQEPVPLRLPPRPGIKRPVLTVRFYTTDCPVCHCPHRTQSEYVDCRLGNHAW